jgi:hypothetical protein
MQQPGLAGLFFVGLAERLRESPVGQVILVVL